ncbi:peptidoglycan-binding protein [Streptomyces sp. NPDC058964]|uniref:peptidoglycan-binding domain-containing protein n=1 Tax=Streptomyces sp. NPDC058964 TaxID=3346681 RepID=UPI0036B6730A
MSTPPDPEQPHPGPVLEPVRVLRLRQFDALAELMREMRQDAEDAQDAQGTEGYEAVAPERWHDDAEDETRELPPVSKDPRATADDGRFGSGSGLRRASVVVAVAAAALVGFGCALLLPGRGDAATVSRPSRPPATAPAPATADATATAGAIDPDGAGTLREGDSGPEVTELQERLLRIPDVYRDGSTDGRYDSVLTAAVARFQLWYGVQGDESGVYGDDTRRALESRTNLYGG